MASAGLAAGVEKARSKLIASVQEYVFLTEVYGLSPDGARRQMGCAGRTIQRYQEYLADHPEVRLVVTAVYDDSEEQAG